MPRIQLENTSSTGSLADVSLRVSFFVRSSDGSLVPRVEQHTPSPGGEVVVELGPEFARERGLFLTALLDGTTVLAQLSVDGDRIERDQPIRLVFDHAPLALEVPEPEPPAPRPAFVYGRLLDKHGRARMEDVQIVFAAVRPGGSEPEPIATAQTEANGYFFFEYPRDSFTAAAALIGMRLKENPVPIRLERTPDADGATPALTFPRRILLVVELAAAGDAPSSAEPVDGKDADCGCETLEMHGAKRVLEEYSFFTLVRTTEPEVRGFALEEGDDLTLGEIVDEHPVVGGSLVGSLVSRLDGITLSPITRPPPTTGPLPGRVELPAALKGVTLKRSVVSEFLSREGALTKDNIVELVGLNESARFKKKVAAPAPQPLGRVVLGGTNAVDWDHEPTLYQAASVAHGHLLQFKAEWIADGYSLGDLLYSLPLAPGQKKQIVVFDWERRESAANVQSVEFEESLYNSLSRDRDVFEITKGTIRENTKGSSSATTASASAGAGGVVGGILFGVSGGVGHSGSNASQDSLRQTSAITTLSAYGLGSMQRQTTASIFILLFSCVRGRA